MERFNDWLSDPRNLVDNLKGKSNEEIKSILDNNSLSVSVLMQQIEHDFNFGSVIRSCNAFGVRDVYYFGTRKKYDRRGTVGSHVYTNVNLLRTVEEVVSLKSKYKLIALENNINRNCEPIYSFNWPKNSLLIIGEEGCGISDEILNLCDYYITIPQKGSVRSFNAAVAASIALYSYSAIHIQ